MEKFISLNDLIKLAKKEHIDLGKGDPYNRLRYYTKMGWLPHMIRKTNDKGDVEGHYPTWAVDILRKIQHLKNEGLANEQVDQKIKVQNNIQKTVHILGDTNNRKRLGIYAVAIVLVLIVLSELNILNIGKVKTSTPNINADITTFYIIDQGTGILPKGAKTILVKTNVINEISKVNVTFRGNYFPATRYWVQNIQYKKGFEISLDIPTNESVTFDWFISN